MARNPSRRALPRIINPKAQPRVVCDESELAPDARSVASNLAPTPSRFRDFLILRGRQTGKRDSGGCFLGGLLRRAGAAANLPALEKDVHFVHTGMARPGSIGDLISQCRVAMRRLD